MQSTALLVICFHYPLSSAIVWPHLGHFTARSLEVGLQSLTVLSGLLSQQCGEHTPGTVGSSLTFFSFHYSPRSLPWTRTELPKQQTSFGGILLRMRWMRTRVMLPFPTLQRKLLSVAGRNSLDSFGDPFADPSVADYSAALPASPSSSLMAVHRFECKKTATQRLRMLKLTLS